MPNNNNSAIHEIAVGKLAQLGATQKFISTWVPSEIRLRYIWSKYGQASTRKNKLSWMRTNRENARLAEVIYSTFCRLYPNNKDLRFILGPHHYLNTHIAVICRESDRTLSIMLTISVLTGIISREIVVHESCMRCGGVQLTHVEDYYTECALCRIVGSRINTKNALANNPAKTT